MSILGIDVSTKAIDMVAISETEPPRWHHYPLEGDDYWERARHAAKVLPGPRHSFWDDIEAVGIERAYGMSSGKVNLVVGTVLAQVPPAPLLVCPWNVTQWKIAVGLKGNAKKLEVACYVDAKRLEIEPWKTSGLVSVRQISTWPQDACDAYCIAIATRDAIRTEAA